MFYINYYHINTKLSANTQDEIHQKPPCYINISSKIHEDLKIMYSTKDIESNHSKRKRKISKAFDRETSTENSPFPMFYLLIFLFSHFFYI